MLGSRYAKLDKEKVDALKAKLAGSSILSAMASISFDAVFQMEQYTIAAAIHKCIEDDSLEQQEDIAQIVFVDIKFFILFLHQKHLTAAHIDGGVLNVAEGQFTIRSFPVTFREGERRRFVDIVFKATCEDRMRGFAFYTADSQGRMIE